jgi:cysteinyl-tRNA synthetase
MTTEINEKLDNDAKAKETKSQALSNLAYIEEVLGFGGQNPFEYFQQGIDAKAKEAIDSLITKRGEAKKAKDFALCDSIRDEILAYGVNIMDTAQGTFWEKI